MVRGLFPFTFHEVANMASRVVEVRHVQDYRLHVTLEDGTSGEIDLEQRMGGQWSASQELVDKAFFAEAQADQKTGKIIWPNGVQLELDGLERQSLSIPITARDEEMNPGLRIARLQREMQQMPEYDLYMQLRGFDISIYTFSQNFADLRNIIQALSGKDSEPLFLIRNRDQLQIVEGDIIRKLHNFVASAQSLIDHVRRLHGKLYATSGRFPDYQPRVDRDFASDPLSQFVGGLRNYCQHYRSPDLSITTSVEGSEMTRRVGLLREDLESFERWEPPAREYLATVEKEVDLLNRIA